MVNVLRDTRRGGEFYTVCLGALHELLQFGLGYHNSESFLKSRCVALLNKKNSLDF